MQSENTMRIAKNTTMLYFRMMLSLAVSLYTSRVVLNTLGIVDFGIYSVVAGIVLMFSFLNSSMATATQRFLSFELGKKDLVELKRVFSMSITIHAIIAIVILIMAETLGLWFLNNKMNIPADRMVAANWVYQFSILSFLFTIMCVPFNAMIIAHERMNVFAYVSIAEVMLKLMTVLSLVMFGSDKLKLYAILLFVVAVIILLIYKTYSNRNFPESRYKFFWDKTLYNTLMNYAGWNLFGNVASVAMGQGVNIMLNIFFGPVVNSARGIAYQVNGAVNGFVSNFQMALNPQIVKSYATKDLKFMHQLIFQGAKYSFFLLFLVTLPVLIETETILSWWLKLVPEYTVIFCKLVLINALIDCISGPLGTAALASGKIRKYHFMVGGLQLFILPCSYLFLKFGFQPQTTFYVSIIFSVIAFFTRLKIISPLVNLPVKLFLKNVLIPVLCVALVSLILPLIIKYSLDTRFIRFVFIGIFSVLSLSTAIYFIGLKKEEQFFLKTKLRQITVRYLKQ